MTRQELARLQELHLIRSRQGEQGEDRDSTSAVDAGEGDEEEAFTALRATWQQAAEEEPEARSYGRIFLCLTLIACLIAGGGFLRWWYMANG